MIPIIFAIVISVVIYSAMRYMDCIYVIEFEEREKEVQEIKEKWFRREF